jgi:hypothetical protein
VREDQVLVIVPISRAGEVLHEPAELDADIFGQDAAGLVERGGVQEVRAPAPASAEEIEAEAVGFLLRFRVADVRRLRV